MVFGACAKSAAALGSALCAGGLFGSGNGMCAVDAETCPCDQCRARRMRKRLKAELFLVALGRWSHLNDAEFFLVMLGEFHPGRKAS